VALVDDPRGTIPRRESAARTGVPLDTSLDTPEARRRSARRDVRIGLGAALALGLLGLLDSLPFLFLSIAVGQMLLAGIARRRPRGVPFGAIRLELTPLGRFVFPATWALVLGAIFVESAPFRWLATLLFAGAASTWPAARANVSRMRLARGRERRARVGAPTSLEVRVQNPPSRAATALATRDALACSRAPRRSRSWWTAWRRARGRRADHRHSSGAACAACALCCGLPPCSALSRRASRPPPPRAHPLQHDGRALPDRGRVGGDEVLSAERGRGGDVRAARLARRRRPEAHPLADHGTAGSLSSSSGATRPRDGRGGARRGNDLTPVGDRTFERAVSLAATVLRGRRSIFVLGGPDERPGRPTAPRIAGRRAGLASSG
jgi:hypothetical protein